MSNSKVLWPTLEQKLRRQELMDRMMQTRGVDADAALRVDGGMAFIEARAKCGYCLHADACRDWLGAEAPQIPPDFCPNAAFFLSCRDTD